ncbi:hypothetical protein COO55_32405 [Rhodococcus opacus]|nr:hypothetical protein COO55_32405 [Rhodococcus opacus]
MTTRRPARPLFEDPHRHGSGAGFFETNEKFPDPDAVVAVNVLDHLDRPALGLHEAYRVLRPDGLFIAGTISRVDSPELAPF